MSRETVLVDAGWVESHLGDDGVVLVEVDEDTTAYDGGHIEGAVKIHWQDDLQDPVRRDFVNQQQFGELVGGLGIGNDDTVVLYGGNNNWFAAYAYWYFTLYGHEKAVLLDGGRKKWELDSRPLTTDEVKRDATSYTAKAPDLSIRAFRDEVVQAIGSLNLVDVRSPDEYAGRLLAPAHLPQERRAQRAVATCRPPPTYRGARQPTRTARSGRRTSSGRSTPEPASTSTSTRSPTAGSASAARTPGSCCTSCSSSRT